MLKDSVISKINIDSFGSKAEKLRRNYPDAKLLVFTDDAW